MSKSGSKKNKKNVGSYYFTITKQQKSRINERFLPHQFRIYLCSAPMIRNTTKEFPLSGARGLYNLSPRALLLSLSVLMPASAE